MLKKRSKKHLKKKLCTEIPNFRPNQIKKKKKKKLKPQAIENF